MKMLVIGAGGMVGAKLIKRLCADGKLGEASISAIIRHDVVLSPPPPESSFPIETLMGDLSVPGEAEKLVGLRPDVIYHLAAIVSGDPRLPGGQRRLECARHIGVVIAAYGGDLFGLSQQLQPLTRGLYFGIEAQIDEVTGDGDVVGPGVPDVGDEALRGFRKMMARAIALPVDITGDPLGHEVAARYHGQGPEMNVG